MICQTGSSVTAIIGVAWGVTALVMHGLGRIFGGAGTFGGALAAVGFAAPIPTFLTMVSNMIWYCYIPFILLSIWGVCLFCIASLRLHQVPLWKGMIIALFSFFAWYIVLFFLL